MMQSSSSIDNEYDDNDNDTSSDFSSSTNTTYDKSSSSDNSDNSGGSSENNFSMTRNSTTSSDDTSYNVKRKNNDKKRRRKLMIKIFCVFANFFLIFINLIIFIIFIFSFMKKIRGNRLNMNIHDNENDNEKNMMMKYELLFYDKKEDKTYNEIVEYLKSEVQFDGYFYPFENENGNGILIKIDNEEGITDDLYQYNMCAEECKCFVECEKDVDCSEGNGMICVEYECVEDDTLKKRRETGIVVDRRVANVVLTVPLLMCVFGVFPALYLAKEYTDRYFMDKCKDTCPTDNVKVEGVSVEKGEKKQNSFQCSAICSGVDMPRFKESAKTNSDRFDEQLQVLKQLVKDEKDGFSTLLKYFEPLLRLNHARSQKLCFDKTVKKDMIAKDENEARALFAKEAQVMCEWILFRWEDEKNLFDLGILKNVCDVNPDSVVCFPKQMFSKTRYMK